MGRRIVDRRRWARRSVAFALAGAIATPMRAAADEPSDACYSAYEQAQRLRNAGKLLASHEQLVACTQPACPEFVRADCATWLNEVEKITPAVVVSGRDERGAPCEQIEVFLDGERIATRVDGRAIAVDPGPHAIRYQLGVRVIEARVVVPEGDKAFPLVADFRPPPFVEPPPSSPPMNAGAGDKDSEATRIPTESYALGGVAALGALSFTVFAIAGKARESCAPHCSDAQISSLRRDYAIADISLITALAAGGGALYFALSKPAAIPSAASRARATGFWLGVRPEAQGASVAAGASF